MQYELKRAVARKKVLTLIVLTTIVQIAPYIILTQLRAHAIIDFITQFSHVIWIVGILIPQSLFIHIVAILISTGSMAEEYEQGTVDLLLTKPLTRMHYFIGKYLGGMTLTAAVCLLLNLLGIVLAEYFFGRQAFLEYAPAIYGSIVFTTLVFYSMGFMFGELFRRTNLAYLTATSIVVAAVFLNGLLFIAFTLTNDLIYLQINKSLPSWGATNLPIMVAKELFLGNSPLVTIIQFGPRVEGTIMEALASIVIYSIVAVVGSMTRFLVSDIPKRIS